MKNLFVILMLLGAVLRGADAPEPVSPTPAPLSAPWDQVSLKDGQLAEGKIRGYDAYFLEFQLINGTQTHLPWSEVASVKPAEFSGDTALMKQYMTQNAGEVSSRISAKVPSQAFRKALFPGFFIHGAGFKEAGNNDMFLSLAGAQLFGMVVGGFGAARTTDPSLSQGEKDTATSLLIGGASIFALTWIIDLIGAPISAGNFNTEHGLSLRF